MQIAVLTFENRDVARNYFKDTGINWPLLVDEQRDIYRAYNMFSASFRDIWGPKTWWAYFKEIVNGHKPQKATGNIFQRGGDVLIDPEGIIRLHHVGNGPADRPSIDSILQVMKR